MKFRFPEFRRTYAAEGLKNVLSWRISDMTSLPADKLDFQWSENKMIKSGVTHFCCNVFLSKSYAFRMSIRFRSKIAFFNVVTSGRKI